VFVYVCARTDRCLHGSVFFLNSPVKTLCAVTAWSSHSINLTHKEDRSYIS